MGYLRNICGITINLPKFVLMFNAFIKHIHTRQLFTANHRLLLAISGGVDSVVLAHLLKMGDYHFELAHCNFQLRGKESILDEKFCRALADSFHVPFHCTSFEVEPYAKAHKLSTQMAARNLRYQWFDSLVKKHSIDFVLTAHHANDSIETFFINLSRGTGINGLKGIPEKNGHLARPLLCFTKKEIEGFAKKEKLKFRLDKSNLENKYERNFIRNEILPRFLDLNPNFETTFIGNIKRLSEETALLHEYLQQKKESICVRKQDLTYIDKTKLKKDAHCSTLLNYLLKPYGFNETQQADIHKHVVANTGIGSNFFTTRHHLSIDRNELIISPLVPEVTESIKISSLGEFVSKAGFHVIRVKKFGPSKKNEIYLNINKLIFPITIRGVATGDKFKPFGMKGFKLVSDFFKDKKMNYFEKQNCKVMLNSNEEIIWVVGHRSDDRYKINTGDSNLVKLTCEP